MQSFKALLQNFFLDRCKKDPKYSLRAYAKFLDIDNASLSKILRGKRKITRQLILKLSEKLNIDPAVKAQFLSEIVNDKSTKTYTPIQMDAFRILSDWFHFAIFELVTVKNFDPTPQAIARQLSITPYQAKNAVERLKRTGLLKEKPQQKLVQTDKFFTTLGEEFTAPALRFLQKGIMERSLKSLEDIPIEKRDHTAMTMAINSKFIPEAKIRIKNFRRSLCEDFQADPLRDSVYQLAISFFPVTSVGNSE